MPHDAVSYINEFAGDVVGCVFDVIDDAAAPDVVDAVDAEVDGDADVITCIDAAGTANDVAVRMLLLKMSPKVMLLLNTQTDLNIMCLVQPDMSAYNESFMQCIN